MKGELLKSKRKDMTKSLLTAILLMICSITICAQEVALNEKEQSAELLKNPSFEDEAKPIRNRRFGPNGEGELFGGHLPAGIIPGWIILEEKDSATKIEISTYKLLEGQNKALRWEITQVPSTIANVGNQGIEAVKGGKYVLSFWARADKRYKEEIRIGLQSKSSDGTWYAKAVMKCKIKKRWKRFSIAFTAEGDAENTRLVMTADKPGVLFLDMMSLSSSDL